MKNLYIDFDGVVVDSIKVTYDMLSRLGVDKENPYKMQEFFSNLNWKQILSLTPIINDSFNCINEIIESKKFNVAILTHVNSIDEAVAKINYIRKFQSDITIIPVPREVAKNKVCISKDAILIDDYSGNLKDWEETGGIGIQFSEDLTKDKGFKVINKLDQIIDLF